MKKMLFVMNPYAGMRRANRYTADIIEIFNRGGYEVTVYMTAGPGDAARIVEERAVDMDIVVCAGGDGTLNETISGIKHACVDIPIGYIPCGSTNDFANSLKLSSNVVQAARDIVEGTPDLLDVGLFGHRYFSYVASFGAFTKASYSAPQNIKNAVGHLAYILEGLKDPFQIKPEHVKIELEDRIIEGDYLFGAISNSTSLAGILTLDPKQVDMADGKFELLLVRAPKDAVELADAINALQTRKYNCAMISFLSTASLTVYASESMPWTLDGEREEGHSVVQVQNLHHANKLMRRKKNA